MSHAFKDGTKPPLYDLSITGEWGLYKVFTPTTRGKRWVKKSLEADRLELGDAVVVEGGDRCRDIVAGAVTDGLEVDALPPNVLNRIVRNAVKALVDEDKMDAIKEQEEEDKTRLREAVAEL